MRTRRRLFTASLATAMVATLLPAAAGAAELVPGRPGRYELSSITIDATSGDCKATYETPAAGNLWMRGVDASVRVRTNRNWVHVTCRFTDMSARIELNTELGYTDACTVVTEAETYHDGWGMATSATNISERAEGGTSFAMCRFRLEPAKPVDGPRSADVSGAAPDRTKGSVRRGEATKAKRSDASEPAGDTRPATRAHALRTPKQEDASLAKASRPSTKRPKPSKPDDHPKRGPEAGKRVR